MVFVGLPAHPINIEEPATNVVLKSITIKTVYGRRIWSTWEACENLIADGKVGINIGGVTDLPLILQNVPKVKPEMIVSHEFPMSSWEEAYEVLMSRDCFKIVMEPQR